MCAFTLLAVIGYILRFVGIRALAWPAVVSHLGLVLFQVVLRAIARRGLAPDPPTVRLQDTQELASFCLAITQTASDVGSRIVPFAQRIGFLRTWSPKLDSQWELVTGELPAEEPTPHWERRVIESIPSTGVLPLKSKRTQSSIKRRLGDAQPGQETRNLVCDLPEVKLLIQVARRHPNLIPPEVTAMGCRLANAVKGVIDVLRSPTGDDIGWKDRPIFDPLDPPEAARVTWEVTLIRCGGRSGNISDSQEPPLVEFPLRSVDSSSLNATLCFWLHNPGRPLRLDRHTVQPGGLLWRARILSHHRRETT